MSTAAPEREVTPMPAGEAHVDLDRLLRHTELPETRISRRVDPAVRAIGRWSAWLWPALVLVITGNVLMRYVIGKGLIEFEELQWHFYAAGFLLTLAWCLEADAHVRIDVLSEHFAFRTRCWIELFGISFALLPFLVFVAWYSVPFIHYSFSIHEVSEAPGGLPYRWVIKAFLLVSFLVLATAAISRLTRVAAALFTRKRSAS
ncbi:MAG TPA: TRAP transporter small permease subunit [Burkholderiaceae bacterium]|nr:TRAP transporter small permease subunit [Burkholderiaceae bacterium]